MKVATYEMHDPTSLAEAVNQAEMLMGHRHTFPRPHLACRGGESGLFAGLAATACFTDPDKPGGVGQERSFRD